MNRPSTGAIAFALIPFAASCFSVSLWDRIQPIIFGLPFNFFWLTLWVLLTPVCIFAAYKVEQSRMSNSGREQDGDN